MSAARQRALRRRRAVRGGVAAGMALCLLAPVTAAAKDNSPPAFGQDLPDRTDPEGILVTIDGGATDPDGDHLHYTAVGLPQGMAIDSGTGTISGSIGFDAAASSPFSVSVTVTDGDLTDIDTFVWAVTNTNRPPEPETELETIELREGDFVTETVEFSDRDEDGLRYRASGLPDGLSIDKHSGEISGVPAAGTSLASPYAVAVSASDDDVTTSIPITMIVEPPPLESAVETSTTSTSTTSTSTTSTSTTSTSTTSTSTTSTTVAAEATGTATPTTAAADATDTTTDAPKKEKTKIAPSEQDQTTETSPKKDEAKKDPGLKTTKTTPPPKATAAPAIPGSGTHPRISAAEARRPLTTEEVVSLKEDLVMAVNRHSPEHLPAAARRVTLAPRQGLAVTFVSSVETFRNNLLMSLGLGIAVAVVLLLGIDDRRDPGSDAL